MPDENGGAVKTSGGKQRFFPQSPLGEVERSSAGPGFGRPHVTLITDVYMDRVSVAYQAFKQRTPSPFRTLCGDMDDTVRGDDTRAMITLIESTEQKQDYEAARFPMEDLAEVLYYLEPLPAKSSSFLLLLCSST